MPKIEEKGFVWVNGYQGYKLLAEDAPLEYISPSLITFYRKGATYQDDICIGFSRKQDLFFYISFLRTTDEVAEKMLPVCSNFLVKYPTSHSSAKHFGFKWFTFLLTEEKVRKLVNKVALLLPQIYERLETGKAGWNIAKSFVHKTASVRRVK